MLGFNVKQLRGKFVERETIMTPLQRAQYSGLRSIGAKTRSIAKLSMKKGRVAKSHEWPREVRELLGIAEQEGRVQGRNKTTGRFEKVADVVPVPRLHSKPGQPPLYYQGLIRKHVYFVADSSTMSVVTGPVALPGVSERGTPELHEYGGRRPTKVGQWELIYIGGRRIVRLVNFETRSVTYEARPYMRPAQAAAVSQLVPKVWEDSLK